MKECLLFINKRFHGSGPRSTARLRMRHRLKKFAVGHSAKSSNQSENPDHCEQESQEYSVPKDKGGGKVIS